MGPSIEYAQEESFDQLPKIVRKLEVKTLIYNELISKYSKKIFFAELLKTSLDKLDLERIGEYDTKFTIKLIAKRLLPDRIQNKIIQTKSIARFIPPKQLKMDFHILAFRMHLISKMHKLLFKDAQAGKN